MRFVKQERTSKSIKYETITISREEAASLLGEKELDRLIAEHEPGRTQSEIGVLEEVKRPGDPYGIHSDLWVGVYW